MIIPVVLIPINIHKKLYKYDFVNLFILGNFCFSFVFGYANVRSWNKGNIKITWVEKLTTAYTMCIKCSETAS